MAAGSTAALICDTGALLDYLVESAPDHRLFRNAIEQARTRYVPGLVLAELDYFLRDERRAMEVFMRDLARGAFTYAPARLDQVTRAMEIDRRFADLGLGLVDGSLVALAEDLDIRRIATRDVRHFAAVRLRDGSAFGAGCPPDGSGSILTTGRIVSSVVLRDCVQLLRWGHFGPLRQCREFLCGNEEWTGLRDARPLNI